jgi:2-dehydro-3-deoxyglucarate aldolase/4-hydroxy-2-oxoheptanedioate aldolase
LRARLRAGEPVLGTMVFEFNTPGIQRILGTAGSDFVIVDLEHTGWSLDAVRPLLAAAGPRPVSPIVRTQGSERHLISPALDAGAVGVMVPMVEDASQARGVVEAARFRPAGGRGFGLVYPDQVAGGIEPALAAIEAETVVILQIESAAAVDRVDEIGATAGVDVLWVGEFDLSSSMGIAGAIDDPRVAAAEERVVAACRSAGLAAGVLVADVDAARSKLELGFTMIAVGTDIGLYGGAVRGALEALRGGMG